MRFVRLAILLLSALFASSVFAAKPQQYVIPLTAGYWTTIYDGYGSITYSTSGILLYPMSATSPNETHAALTLANTAKMRNFRLKVTAITEMQLRQNSQPNPWEVFWIFFNYNPTSTGKATNYFLLKPTGAELGTAYDGNGQTFLQTVPSSIPAIGQLNTFLIEKIDNRVTVSVNGVQLIDYTGAVFDTAGNIGLYTEDAGVKVTGVSLTPL